ncbi:MAG: cytochrome c biogenesis protein CcsA [Crocinitomicaceae bacterium]|nr:cytochrome c biogenesis protein CcsA [Crocinitomicaceae bacterium]
MDKLLSSLFSMRWASVGLIVFLVAIGAATFIESIHGIQAAKISIYNAFWFEGLLLYLVLALVSNIFRYKMFSRAKIAMLSFHLSFIVILAGAAVTRYVSFEGLMVIREGSSSNFIYTSDPYVLINAQDITQKNGATALQAWKTYLSEFNNNDFDYQTNIGKKEISIRYVNFMSDRVDSLQVNQKFKENALELVTDGMRSNYLAENDVFMVGQTPFYFSGARPDAPGQAPGVYLHQKDGKTWVYPSVALKSLPMSEMQKVRASGQAPADSLYTVFPLNEWSEFTPLTLYLVGGQQVVFKRLIPHAKKMLVKAPVKKTGKDYLTIELSDGKATKKIRLEGGIGQFPKPERFAMNGVVYQLEYGSIQKNIPFSVRCRDFRLDKYPGSNAPSSFESELTIEDPRDNVKLNRKVFMNNVIDYDGYRFFQSSYELDDPNTPENEEGTKLSVNHDSMGTNITYIGYLLMALAMILSLFAPVGRFTFLSEQLQKVKAKKASLGIIALLLSSNLLAQHQHQHQHKAKPVHHEITTEHADELASLLVQDYEGRIVPFHTLADQLTRKLTHSNKYKELNAVQFVLSLHMYPSYWVSQPFIQVPRNLREPLKLKEFESIMSLSSKDSEFKWMAQYQAAHQKLESKRNEFDKKLIKLNEKYEVANNIFMWQFMRVIPAKNDANNTWFVPLSMELGKKDTLSSKLFVNYLAAVHDGGQRHTFGEATDVLKSFKKFQRTAGKAVAPTERVVNLEISYNKMQIFKRSYQLYLLSGLLLLIVFFIGIFFRSEKELQRLKWPKRIFIAITVVTFVYHGVGLGLRWAISGHAPWSNGYEAIVFIGWVTMIAGFAFAKKNQVVLAGAAVLAALMLWVTEMNLMDPEITPLVPVLKSYWLMIHVAIITGSYGFLGLACILGLINLKLYLLQSEKSAALVKLNIQEITYISEMTMTVGLYMLTIGTFLGGVWANESWGRYWGWDPKETWALVSVLVYAVILHFRMIPGLQGRFLFNALAFWGYSAILFTFFGVNFMLVGLHSYAQGEGLGQFPTWLIYLIIAFALLTTLAFLRNKSIEKKQKDALLNS